MIKIFSAVTFALLSITSANAAESCQVLQQFVNSACGYEKTLKLISDPDKMTVDKSNCDSKVDNKKWEKQPSVQFSAAKPDKTYTIICLDPDTYKGKKLYWLHWLIVNIPGKDFQKGDLSRGRSKTKYRGPGRGNHSIIFLAFEEEHRYQEVAGSLFWGAAERVKFDILRWIRRQPKRLCGPVAGVQFCSNYF